MRRERTSKVRAAALPSTVDPATVVEGTVVGVSPGGCTVEVAGTPREARRPDVVATHLAVGDRVRLGDTSEGSVLTELLPRRTVLSRPDPHDGGRELLIAANVDVVVVVASAKEPAFHPRLLDRYLVAIARGGAEALVCVNKWDLADEAERASVRGALAAYEGSGARVAPCSVTTGEGLEAVREAVRGRVCVFVGHSGVGKSSLVAAIAPSSGARAGAVSQAHRKGRHTTTASALYTAEDGTQVIDTPGVRAFGLWAVDARALGWYFPEFDAHRGGCRFSDCSHSHEPKCGVRSAAESGALPRVRYDTYLRILGSLS